LQFGAERLAEFADVPTAVEMASDELDKEMLRFYALKYEMAYAAITPPGVPDERVAALKRAFDATMRDPVYVATARKLNLPLNFVSSAEVQDIMARVMNTPEPPARRFRDIMEAVTRH
jgi:tripartite-type tricarboxylate transporter receptor subunit TctC